MKLAFIISKEESKKIVYEINEILFAMVTSDCQVQTNEWKQTENNIEIKPQHEEQQQQQRPGKKSNNIPKN